MSKTTTIRFIYDDIVIGVFVYYLYGMIISRLGSLLIEPVFRKAGFVVFRTMMITLMHRLRMIKLLFSMN